MIPYFGGKSYTARWIISNFPENYKDLTYCEVFGGGGWVLFKKEPSSIEVYNDLNRDLVNLFLVIRDRYKEFAHRAEWSLHSRAMFDYAKAKLSDDRFLSQTERAIHYAINRVQSFSGSGSTWAYRITSSRFSGKWLPFLNRLALINARLKKVQIECLDFEKVIRKYDSKSTLFYLDPPYIGGERYYKTKAVDFKPEDHERLAKVLKKIKGRFILSYYDNKMVRERYKGFRVIAKEVPKYSVGNFKNKPDKRKPLGRELLIMNY